MSDLQHPFFIYAILVGVPMAIAEILYEVMQIRYHKRRRVAAQEQRNRIYARIQKGEFL
jgi:predicted transcriptional regulator